MKIKLSKSQWEYIGKTAGWIQKKQIKRIAVDTQDVLKDKNGNPIVFYHGTKGENFSEFDTNRSGYHYGRGSYFTPSPDRASYYSRKSQLGDDENNYPTGSRLYPVYIILNNPFITNSHEGVVDVGFKAKNDPQNENKYSGMSYAEIGNKILREQGYDGVIKPWTWSANDPLEVVVFNSNSIKSIYS